MIARMAIDRGIKDRGDAAVEVEFERPVNYSFGVNWSRVVNGDLTLKACAPVLGDGVLHINILRQGRRRREDQQEERGEEQGRAAAQFLVELINAGNCTEVIHRGLR